MTPTRGAKSFVLLALARIASDSALLQAQAQHDKRKSAILFTVSRWYAYACLRAYACVVSHSRPQRPRSFWLAPLNGDLGAVPTPEVLDSRTSRQI